MRWPWHKHAEAVEQRAREQVERAEQRMQEAKAAQIRAEIHKARALRFVAENHISPKLANLYRGKGA